MNMQSVIATAPLKLGPELQSTNRQQTEASTSTAATAKELAAQGGKDDSKPVGGQVLQTAVENVNKTIKAMGRSLEFTVDEDTKINLVKVIDKETKQVIRQIPSQEVVEIAKALDKLQGLLLRDKA